MNTFSYTIWPKTCQIFSTLLKFSFWLTKRQRLKEIKLSAYEHIKHVKVRVFSEKEENVIWRYCPEIFFLMYVWSQVHHCDHFIMFTSYSMIAEDKF